MNKRLLYIFLSAYLTLRFFSFFFSPATPLYAANPINSIATLLYLLFTIYYLLIRSPWGWYLIALEIILGGSGGYLAIQGISLRTLLLLGSIFIYKVHLLKDKKVKTFINENRYPLIIITLLVIYAVFSALYGYSHGHTRSLIIADFIPYLFLFYYFPLKDLLASKSFKPTVFQTAIVAAIVGNFILIAVTFIGFSSGVFVLQDAYYHWYRDIALGKIAELPFHFYRLVINEHLLLIPLIIYIFYKSIIAKKNLTYYSILLLPLLAVLAVNLTRIYLVALAIGIVALFRINYWKRWLVYGAVSAGAFVLIFTSIHLVASRGQSLGLELFGLRLQSIASPSIEDSSLSRMLLLPKIMEKINAAPLLGTGLGDQITVYSPVFKKDITTPHFDWGYLEIIAEMGLVGLLLWLGLLGSIFKSWRQKPLQTTLITETNQNFSTNTHKPWIAATLAALLVINLTSPAIFHVLGILWLTILIARTNN